MCVAPSSDLSSTYAKTYRIPLHGSEEPLYIGEYAFVTNNTFLNPVLREQPSRARVRSKSCDTALALQRESVKKGWTTVMLHSVSCRRPPEQLFDVFFRLGFTHNHMDYVYFPMREKGRRLTGTGYMFINFVTPELAVDFVQALNADGLRARSSSESSKAIFCSFADTQGFSLCVEQFLMSKGKGLRNPAWLRHGEEWAPLFRE